MAEPHARKMTAPEPEMMSTDDIAYTQLHELKGKEVVALNEWVHWDPSSGKMLKAAKPKKTELVPTGSMKQTDLACSDCGAELEVGSLGETGRVAHLPNYYLVCARLANYGIGAPYPKPVPPNSVVECGLWEPAPEPVLEEAPVG